jgi:hypothetical protein
MQQVVLLTVVAPSKAVVAYDRCCVASSSYVALEVLHITKVHQLLQQKPGWL